MARPSRGERESGMRYEILFQLGIPTRPIETEADFDKEHLELAAGDQSQHPGDTTKSHAIVDKPSPVSLASHVPNRQIV